MDIRGGQGERGRGSSVSLVFIGKSVFGHLLSILTGCGSPKVTTGSSIYIEKGASSIIERSALAGCNVLIMRNRNTLQTICFSDLRAISLLLFSSSSFLFFYDDAMRGDHDTRTKSTQPTTTTDTRHDTAPHNKNNKGTHTYTHMYMYLYVYMYMSVFHVHVGVIFAHFP